MPFVLLDVKGYLPWRDLRVVVQFEIHRMKPNSWEFVRREDGTYAVSHKGKLLKENIPERWFYEQICIDYGFCGEESAEIRRQIGESGKCTIVL